METQVIKVKGVRIDATNKPVESEDMMPVPSPSPEPVKVDIADLAKLVNYAKKQGWI
jgi:hypothetical protein